MNFIEIFRKYDKVVESFIGKTKSKTVKGIIDDADRYVSKDKEILRQLKEFVKQDGYEEDFGFKEDLPGQFYIEHQNDEGEFEEWVIIELNLVTSVEDGMYSYSVVSLGEKDSYVEVVAVPEDYSDYDNIRWEELDINTRNQILDYLNFTDLRYDKIDESFTRKIRSKKNDELTSKADTAFVPDGVYILHETLGVNGVEGWNPKNNNGVVGVLLIEDDHKIVVATEDSPENLTWSNEYGLIKQPIEELEDAESDFNGEMYCQKLNSPDFPAAYYCKTYNKGGRSWYLPSSGELWLIYNHLEEIQNALSIVGGQKLITNWDEGVTVYWSSTERSATGAWYLYLDSGGIYCWRNKVSDNLKVRPVFNFNIKESATEKKDSSNYPSQTSEQSVPSVNISSNDSWRNIIDVYRKDGSIRKVSIMKDRNTGKFCFVNLTSSHVCKYRFDTFGDAIKDLMTREEVEYFDIHYAKDPIIE